MSKTWRPNVVRSSSVDVNACCRTTRTVVRTERGIERSLLNQDGKTIFSFSLFCERWVCWKRPSLFHIQSSPPLSRVQWIRVHNQWGLGSPWSRSAGSDLRSASANNLNKNKKLNLLLNHCQPKRDKCSSTGGTCGIELSSINQWNSGQIKHKTRQRNREKSRDLRHRTRQACGTSSMKLGAIQAQN